MNKVSDEPVKSSEETLLWEQFTAGDDNAFAQLFELFSDRLFRFGTKFVHDEELVKDCIQELFVGIYRNRQRLPVIKSPSLYLFKSMKNRILDSIHKKDRLRFYPLDELSFFGEFIFNPEEEAQQQVQDLEYEQLVNELFLTIINKLTSRQQEAIYLHYQLGMSYEETAEVLHINYQSIRNLMFRAIQKIRSEMSHLIQ